MMSDNTELEDQKLLRRGSEILSSQLDIIVFYTQFEVYDKTLKEYLCNTTSGIHNILHHLIGLSYQIVSGLYTIHKKYKLVHGNLSTNSIYIGCNGKAKIGDFGFATKSKLLIPIAPSPSSSPIKTLLCHSGSSNYKAINTVGTQQVILCLINRRMCID
jgi:serine/threonine protein kinase